MKIFEGYWKGEIALISFKLKKFKIPEEKNEQFCKELTKRNLSTGHIVLSFVTVFELINLVFVCITSVDKVYRVFYIVLYSTLFLASVGTLFLIIRFKKSINKSYKTASYFVYLYLIFLMLWSVIKTFVDFTYRGYIINFFVTLIGCSCLILLKPKISAIFLSSYYTISMVSLLLDDRKLLDVYFLMNMAFITIIAMIVSLIRYFDLVKEYKFQLRIIKQNRDLKYMNKMLNKLNLELKRISETDRLSELYNRWYLDTKLNEVWENCLKEAKTLTVLMIDIDDFKQINDKYGHFTGDECIRKVAKILLKYTTPLAAFCFRFGGEEFLILMPGCQLEEAYKISEMIRRDINSLNIKRDMKISISGGICSVTPNSKMNPEEIVHRADKALYNAKAKGKNMIWVEEIK